MATIRVNVGSQELVFRMTATLENVQKIIRGSCGLELGRLEDLDGVTLTTGDDFIAGATYNFVGGMAPGGPAIVRETMAKVSLFRRFLETFFGGAILPGSVAFIRSIDSASASAAAIITYFTLIFCLNCGQQAVRDKALLREVFEKYRGEHTTNEGRGEEGGVSTAPQNSDLITVNSDEQALTYEDIVLL